MRHAIILAGGSGTRLWPASRRASPKQLLSISKAGQPLIAAAVAIGRAITQDGTNGHVRAKGRVLIVTAEALVEATRAAVPDVEILAEPAARNTAAAIGLAGALIAESDPEAVLTVLPADHHVRDPEGLTDAVDACLAAVERSDAIALVGIPPTRPETGFGYLELAPGPSDGVRSVLRFVEKPDLATAESYIASGRYLWNAGIFCLTARRLLMELSAHLPRIAQAAKEIARDPNDPTARELYAGLPSVSFDVGIMEKTVHVVAAPAAVGWNDVGSWAAIPEVQGRDASGNTIIGQAVVIDGSGNVVVTDDGTLVATVGVSDLVIVKSGDAILIVRRDQAQRVREIVDVLGASGLARYL